MFLQRGELGKEKLNAGFGFARCFHFPFIPRAVYEVREKQLKSRSTSNHYAIRAIIIFISHHQMLHPWMEKSFVDCSLETEAEIFLVSLILGLKQFNYKGHNYFYSGNVPELANKRVDWLEARNLCREYCMDAVSIETQEENNLIFKLIQENDVPYIWTSGRLCDFNGKWLGQVEVHQILNFYSQQVAKVARICFQRTKTDGSGLQTVKRFNQPTVTQLASGTIHGHKPDTRRFPNQTMPNLTSIRHQNHACQFSTTFTTMELHG